MPSAARRRARWTRNATLGRAAEASSALRRVVFADCGVAVGPSATVGAAGSQGGPGGLESSHGHPEGRAGDVVKADLVEEVDRLRVTAVLATDAALEPRTHRPALLDGQAHQGAHALSIDRLEGRDAEDALVEVGGEERRLDIISTEAPGRR
ncbi:MAG: hypothetical protein RLZZ11_1873 [Cyanobacteriota bacterium]